MEEVLLDINSEGMSFESSPPPPVLIRRANLSKAFSSSSRSSTILLSAAICSLNAADFASGAPDLLSGGVDLTTILLVAFAVVGGAVFARLEGVESSPRSFSTSVTLPLLEAGEGEHPTDDGRRLLLEGGGSITGTLLGGFEL